MTRRRFEKLLQEVNPKLRLRVRGFGDIVGVFAGLSGKSGYIVRATKGEITPHGYRLQVIDPTNPMEYKQGKIVKRGRKTILNILRNYRWIEKHKDRSRILWGLKS